MAEKAAVSFRINGKTIRSTSGLKEIVLGGISLNARSDANLARAATKTVAPKIEETISGFYQLGLETLRRANSRGFRGSINPPTEINIERSIRGTTSAANRRLNVALSHPWQPLQKRYRERKAREGNGARVIWKYKQGLSSVVTKIGNVKSPTRFTRRVGKKRFVKGYLEYEWASVPSNLPDPLQGLMRRSFMQRRAVENYTVSQELDDQMAVIYFMEVTGVGRRGSRKGENGIMPKGKVRRPFIADISAALGVAAHNRLNNLKF